VVGILPIAEDVMFIVVLVSGMNGLGMVPVADAGLSNGIIKFPNLLLYINDTISSRANNW
jgi:hypothetical protein